MAATNYRDEMMAADELDPKRKVRRGMRMLDPSRAEGPATSDVNFRPRTGSDPAPATPPNGGALGQQPGAGYVALETAKNVGRTFNPLAGGANNNVVPYYTGEGPGISGTLPPKPKTPDQLAMADAGGVRMPTTSAIAPPSGVGSSGGFAGMGARSMRDARPDPEMLATGDTEQGRRDLAKLRKQRNIDTAKLMATSNRWSAFNPSNPNYTPDRGERIMAIEDANQQLATAQRAANPPRYADTPGKSPEQMMYEEAARNRQQQAVVQANTDQGARDKTRQYQTEYNDAMRTSSLTRAKTEGTIAKAEGTTAEAAANRAAAESEIAAAAIPNEVARARAMEQRGNSPTYAQAVSRVAEGIKSLSGQAIRPTGMVEARRVLNEGIATLNAMPPDLQRVAAAEILSNLRAENLDLPKDAYQDAWFKWLINGAGFLNTPTDRQTSAVQSQINQTLQILKDKAAKSGVNPTMFQTGAAG